MRVVFAVLLLVGVGFGLAACAALEPSPYSYGGVDRSHSH